MSQQTTAGPPPPPPPPQLQPPQPSVLPFPWTEHKAPGGQSYWYNPHSNISTYTRPSASTSSLPPPPPPGFTHFNNIPPPLAHGQQQHQQPAAYPMTAAPLHFSLSGTNTVPLIVPAGPVECLPPAKAKKEKKEKPLTKTVLEGTDWTRVITTKGNTFYTNRETKESVWTVPAEIKEMVEEMDRVEKQRKEEEMIGGTKRKVEEAIIALEAKAQSESIIVKDEDKEDGTVEPPAKRKKERVVNSMKNLGKREQTKIIAAVAADQAEDAVSMEMEMGGEGEEEAQDEGEAWQRALLEEMVIKKKVVEDENVKPILARLPASLPAIPRMEVVSPEESAALFRIMLSEKDISPLAPWDNELPKFVDDSRYLAVKSLNERRNIFDDYCKELLRSIRAAKKAAQEAGETKVDPLTAYRALLSVAVTSTRTHFSDFKRSHSKDPRFRDFGKTEGDKEKVFKTWLRELGERKRGEAKLGEERFSQMLREDSRIVAGDTWSKVKTQFVSDPRYDAVPSSSLRESLFVAHLASLASGSSSSAAANVLSKAEKAAKAAASLKEREEQVRSEQQRSSRNATMARGAMGREEGQREFMSMLIDAVRDHEAQWNAVAPGLERDPRFKNNSLSMNDKRRLFDSHLVTLYAKRIGVLEELFSSHSPLLTTPFTDVLPEISSSPHVIRLVGKDFDRLESLYKSYNQKRELQSRREFDELLQENSVVQYWVKMQKETMNGDAQKIADEEEDDDEEAIDLRTMANQVDLPAIEAVLKHDKRFLIFNHVPEARRQWISDFISTLSAPKVTVHQM